MESDNLLPELGEMALLTHSHASLDLIGLEIRGCKEPRAPLNSPVAPSNFCREPKDELVSLHNTFRLPLKMQLGSLKKIIISSPLILTHVL